MVLYRNRHKVGNIRENVLLQWDIILFKKIRLKSLEFCPFLALHDSNYPKQLDNRKKGHGDW